MTEVASPERRNFSKIRSFMDLPNLIDVQRRSYERFLQMNLLPEEREDSGLQAVFTSVFPFSDFRGACELQFVKYSIGNWECKCGRLKGLEHLRMDCRSCGARIVTAHPHEETVTCPRCGTQNPNRVTLCDVCGNPVDLQMKYSVAECQERGMTYSVPLKVTFRLFVYDKDPETGVKTMRDAKEEEVFFGDIPLMTEHGTFVINGTERVIVSQLHRSPGVFFTRESKQGFLAKIIPYRGSWVEFEFDQKGVLFVRIDRKRKFPATIFLRALGLETDESILRQFYATVPARFERGRAYLTVSKEVLKQEELKERYARVKRETKTVFAGIRLSGEDQREIAKKGSIERSVDDAAVEKACFLADVVDLSTGEVLFEAGQELGADAVEGLKERGIKEIELFFPDWDLSGDVLVNTIRKDSHKTRNEAILEIYRRLRPGDPPTYESAKNLFEGMFFDPKKYDFSRVGRFKFNIKLEADSSEDTRTLTSQDIYRVVAYLLRLKRDVGRTDDIDNLGNRRVRSVGELLENQFRIGLVRMERAIKEKMSVHQDIDSAMPHDLINSKPVIASIKEFYGSSQLSQFMDQTNPLSEVTHKRRLSALGPGGLSRERAGFEVRDVHPSHYGRMCPIETPEGPNIGLIGSLSSYGRINPFGFIETPYRRVVSGKATDKIDYLSADEEDRFVIAQANEPIDKAGKFGNPTVLVRRKGGEVDSVVPAEVDYMDVSPKQLISVAAALIPFLEHDDANRALMGANMQRQAV
ncbi:MAG TPA: DNA-directed RNA polymerase subunit beta, partial [Thermoanaerobaculia bacterium]|nr:DNA-directed RNA polymerase subunit beta [Thermoanaerobaculia bacterium]